MVDLTVVSSAVPEPATWAMLGLGFLGLGGLALRRQQRALAASTLSLGSGRGAGVRAPEAAGVRETPGRPPSPSGEGGHRSRRARACPSVA